MMSRIMISSGDRTVTVQTLGLTRRQRAAAQQTALTLLLAVPLEPAQQPGPPAPFGFGPPEYSTTSNQESAEPGYDHREHAVAAVSAAVSWASKRQHSRAQGAR